METTASSCIPAWLEWQVLRASWDALDWVSWKLPAVAAFLVLQPGAWIPAGNARQNQAINEMYCFGPPCPTLGEGKNCTVSRTKHTHLALTSGDGFFPLVGPEAGPMPLGERLPQLAAQEASRSCWHS